MGEIHLLLCPLKRTHTVLHVDNSWRDLRTHLQTRQGGADGELARAIQALFWTPTLPWKPTTASPFQWGELAAGLEERLRRAGELQEFMERAAIAYKNILSVASRRGEGKEDADLVQVQASRIYTAATVNQQHKRQHF